MDLPPDLPRDLPPKTILVVGTYDTTDDELSYLSGVIRSQGGRVLTMDVAVLGDPRNPTDISKHQVAAAARSTIAAAIAAEDENFAMQVMARAGRPPLPWHCTAKACSTPQSCWAARSAPDLALDLTAALPMGVPKYVASTVSFSAMIPIERLPPICR